VTSWALFSCPRCTACSPDPRLRLCAFSRTVTSTISENRPHFQTKRRTGDATSACKSSFWRRSRGEHATAVASTVNGSQLARRADSWTPGRPAASRRPHPGFVCSCASCTQTALPSVAKLNAEACCALFRLRRSSLRSTTGLVPY